MASAATARRAVIVTATTTIVIPRSSSRVWRNTVRPPQLTCRVTGLGDVPTAGLSVDANVMV